jgi:hypothetical protein
MRDTSFISGSSIVYLWLVTRLPMAKAAPTDVDLAEARLLIARSDKAKKTRKPKGSKGANLDQENKDPNETKKKKTVMYVTLLNACLTQLMGLL